MFEFGYRVRIFVADSFDCLLVARDVAAEANAVALLVAVAGLEVRDLKVDRNSVAEGQPLKLKVNGLEVEGERIGRRHLLAFYPVRHAV
jgi:hypothetical protein